MFQLNKSTSVGGKVLNGFGLLVVFVLVGCVSNGGTTAGLPTSTAIASSATPVLIPTETQGAVLASTAVPSTPTATFTAEPDPYEAYRGDLCFGITPGVTLFSQFDLSKFVLAETVELPEGRMLYEYWTLGDRQDMHPTFFIGTSSSGVIEYVGSWKKNQHVGALEELISLLDLGSPDMEVMYPDPNILPPEDEASIFLRAGFSFEASSFNGEVHFVRCFKPTSREEFLTNWSHDLYLEKPYSPPEGPQGP